MTDKNQIASNAVNEICDQLAAEVAQGLLLKNASRRLARHLTSQELVNKLTRIIELRANDLMYKAAR